MSNMTAELLVKEVVSRRIKAGTPDERLVYDVIDGSDVKWTAWEKDLAEKAFYLKGKVGVAEVKVEQNGKYTNRTLVSIVGKDEGFGSATSNGGQTMTTATTGTFSTGGFNPGPATQADYRERTIFRQTAAKVAAGLSQNPNEFWANVQDLAQYFETGETPSGNNSPGYSSEPFGPSTDPFTPEKDDDLPF